MKILVDENVDKDFVSWLQSSGHDVLYCAEISPGAQDTEWLAVAYSEGRLILTSDKDFGELVFRDNLNCHGLVLLRLDELSTAEGLARLQAVWSVIEANPSRHFIVV